IGDLIECVAIGVRSLELKATIKVVRSSQYHTVVVGISHVLCLSNDSESRVGLHKREPTKWSADRTECIQGRIRDFLVLTMIANVFRAHRSMPTQSLLYFQVPLEVTRDLHFSRIEEIESGNRSTISEIGAKSCIGRRRLPVQVPWGCG